MRRRDKASSKAVKPRRQKTSTHRNAPKTVRRNRAVSADLQDQLDRRTRELNEALEQQTATSEVLRVISSSSGELAPVFESLLASAKHLCGADFGIILLREGDAFRTVALHGATAEYTEARWHAPFIRPAADTGLGRVLETKQVVQIADVRAVPGYVDNPVQAPIVQLAGVRSKLCVPMLKEDDLIGVIEIDRQEVRPFTEKQIQLVQNFAAQAVIAIENARLLNELRQRTDDLSEALEQQTATSAVLQVISNSPGELEPVFQTILSNATRICDAKFGDLYLRDADGFRMVATHNSPPAFAAARTPDRLLRPPPDAPLGLVSRTLQVAHVHDIRTIQSYINGDPFVTAGVELAGYRTILAIPMLKDNELIGAITICRLEVRPFIDKQIALMQSFAAQAVIAIENTRLLNELRQRTDDLSKLLDNLRTAQDRLVQTEKLASLGQLTAGIAHEIKNPLNFVNNFSAISVELIDDLREALTGAHLHNKLRTEINEIADMLQGNLDKVVQHGKRADSIVKNMLLHSRQGSGEHRPVDINALVEESLNLAYHGARAEKQDFNITLERSFDPTAGEVDVFPQEITRALLNLISNGFYAATKRKRQRRWRRLRAHARCSNQKSRR